MATWDPSVYLAFADHRTRPFVELINAVDLGPEQVAGIVDLGCGPGHLTQYLRRRWPDAQILGIDSSPEMIEQASTENDDPRASYAVEDVSTWLPAGPVDLIVSNAMFQWVDDQWNVLDRLLERLSPGGAIALSVPDNAEKHAHRSLYELASREPYAEHLLEARRLQHLGADQYLRFFTNRGLRVNAWATTYLQILTGDDPVFTWVSGTGARPFLQGLDDDLRATFVEEYKAMLRAAYPSESFGTVFPFTRTFAVATKTSPA